jgi:hypothetical protein
VKRIFLLGAVVAGLFIFGVAGALAATHATHRATGRTRAARVALTKVTCRWSISQQVPGSDQTNTPGAVSGTQAGGATCGGKLGRGVEADTFATADSGNISGTWQQWFNTGSLYGRYTLAQNELTSPPSTDSFAAASYSGVMTVRNGTGTEARSVGVGTINCATQDAVHFTCVARLRVHIPALSPARK